jgi:DNA polymerase IV
VEIGLLRWLVLDLNSFFASCEQQEDPELRDRPVIVVQTMAETTCAIAASYPAKALGIRTGTLVHEARRLCPDLKLVQANHKLYVDAGNQARNREPSRRVPDELHRHFSKQAFG